MPQCWRPRFRWGQGGQPSLVSGQGWHPGVVGIVAGRIKERFNRPACVAGFADGIGKGSGRSVPGIDLGAAVIAARQSGLLVTGGGHPMAAGFSVQAERLEAFHAFLDERLAAASVLPGAADLVIEGSLAVSGATVEVGAASGTAGSVRGWKRGTCSGAASGSGRAGGPGGAGGGFDPGVRGG